MLERQERYLRLDFRLDGGVGDYLAHFAELCRPRGVGLTVVYIPNHGSVHPDYLAAMKRLGGDGLDAITTLSDPAHRRQQEHLREVTAALGLPLLDMTDALTRAEEGGTRTFWAFDGHCTAAGYRLIAEACARSWAAGRPGKAPGS
jgi:hypothetical protein